MKKYQCGARFMVNIKESLSFVDDECMLCQIGFQKYTLIGTKSGNRWSDEYLEYKSGGFTLSQMRKHWSTLSIKPIDGFS